MQPPDNLMDDDALRAYIDAAQGDEATAQALRAFQQSHAMQRATAALPGTDEMTPSAPTTAGDLMSQLGAPTGNAGAMPMRTGQPSGAMAAPTPPPPVMQAPVVSPTTPNADKIQQAAALLRSQPQAGTQAASLLGAPGPVTQMPPPAGRTLTTTHTRSVTTNPFGSPPSVSNHQPGQDDIAEAEDALRGAHQQTGMARALGMMGMAMAQGMSGPLGLPNAELLYKMLPSEDSGVVQDAQQHLVGLRQNAERGAQQRMEQEQWTRQQQNEADKERARQGFQASQGALDRAARLRAAQIAAQGGQARVAGQGDAAMALERQRAADREALWRLQHPHADGTPGHGGGGLSREAVIEGYIARQAENARGADGQGPEPTPEQRQLWRTQAEGMTTQAIMRGAASHEAATAHGAVAGDTNAARATQQQAALAQRQATQTQHVDEQHRVALQRAGIPDLEVSLNDFDRIASNATDADLTMALPAIGHPMLISALPDRAARIAQTVTAIQNKILHPRAGSAVTNPEAMRLAAELGTGGLSPARLREGIAGARRSLEAQRNNILNGPGTEAPGHDDLSDLGATEVR